MPKANKKKKDKDFQKVKLKVGRKIPKCLNETDTSFRTQKILMPTSRVMADDPMGALISSLRDGKSLKLLKLSKASSFIPTAKPQDVSGDAINVLCRLLMDDHNEVRTEALKILQSCFDVLIKSGTKMEPILAGVITHLKCALTHLNQFIYKDAWKLLTSLVENASNDMVDQLGNLMVQIFPSREHPPEHFELLAHVIEKMYPHEKNKHNTLDYEPIKVVWSQSNNYAPINTFKEEDMSVGFCISLNDFLSSESLKEETLKKIKALLKEDFVLLNKIDIKLDRKMKAIQKIYERVNCQL